MNFEMHNKQKYFALQEVIITISIDVMADYVHLKSNWLCRAPVYETK